MAKEKWRVLSNPKKDMKVKSINIECVDPEEDEGYVVTVCPQSKDEKPGKTQKSPPYTWVNPIKKVFKTCDEICEYLKEVL
jgi:hypothetical protein